MMAATELLNVAGNVGGPGMAGTGLGGSSRVSGLSAGWGGSDLWYADAGASLCAASDDKDEDEAYFEGEDEVDDDEDEFDDFDEFEDEDEDELEADADDDDDEEL